MGRSTELTYDQVAQLASQLKAQGINPTNQAIKNELGGSFTTIAPLLKQWREANQAPQPQATPLPDTIVKAINAEVSRQVKEATASLQAQLDDTTATLEGVMKEHGEAATHAADVERQLGEAHATINQKQGAVDTLTLQVKQEQDRNAALSQEVHNLQVSLARAEHHKEMIETLKSEAEALRKALAAADKKK